MLPDVFTATILLSKREFSDFMVFKLSGTGKEETMANQFLAVKGMLRWG